MYVCVCVCIYIYIYIYIHTYLYLSLSLSLSIYIYIYACPARLKPGDGAEDHGPLPVRYECMALAKKTSASLEAVLLFFEPR